MAVSNYQKVEEIVEIKFKISSSFTLFLLAVLLLGWQSTYYICIIWCCKGKEGDQNAVAASSTVYKLLRMSSGSVILMIVATTMIACGSMAAAHD